MTKLKDIAKSCGVSVSAVCTAINHPQKISPAVRNKILNTAREMGYFKKVKVKKILIAADNMQNHFFGEYYGEVLFGIQEALSAQKINFNINSKFSDLEYADIYEYDGIIFTGKTPESFIKKALEFRKPFVLAGHPNPIFKSHAVYQDCRSALEYLVDFLLSCGHRKIAVLTGETNPEDVNWSEFLAVLKNIFAKNSLPFKTSDIYIGNYSEIESVEIIFNKIISQKNKYTAVICSSDLLAYYFAKAAQKYKKNIPQDISITGFDGISFPRYTNNYGFQLTTAFSDRIVLGQKSVEVLLDVINNNPKDKIVLKLPMKPIIGNSVIRV